MMPTAPVAYSSVGAVIGIAVLGSLVVALVVLFIGYRHWQKGKEHQHLAVAYSSGRLDGSEYVMPGELAWGRGTLSHRVGGVRGTWEAGSGELERGREAARRFTGSSGTEQLSWAQACV